MLADIWSRDGRIFTWYDQHMWAVFYDDVPRRDALPRILSVGQIAFILRDSAASFVIVSNGDLTVALDRDVGEAGMGQLPFHLLDLLESPFAPRNFDLPPEAISVLWKHTHRFLERLVEVGYDEWPKIPILIDWNLGNFSVETFDDGLKARIFQRFSQVPAHVADESVQTIGPVQGDPGDPVRRERGVPPTRAGRGPGVCDRLPRPWRRGPADR